MSVSDTAKDGPGATSCPWAEAYDPFSTAELRDPYPSLAAARRDAPVFYSERFGRLVVTRREDALAVLADVEHFSSRAAQPFPDPPQAVWHRLPTKDGRAVLPSALTPLILDGEEHRRARDVIQAPFTPRAIRVREPMIRAIANRIFDRASDGRMDLVNDYALPFALEVVSRIVGVPHTDLPLILRGIDAVFQLNARVLSDDDDVLAAAETVAEYWEYVSALAESRCREPQDDFASVIAQTQDRGERPTPARVAQHIHSLISPGFETSAQAITHGLAALLARRDQWELLKSDRSLVERAVMEMLRYRAIAKFVFRQATSDVDVGGVTIPAGSNVAVSLASANRDEAYYDHPDAFDITRRVDNLTFGKWKHYCVGAPLAKLELKVTLETLMDRFPDATIPAGQELVWRRDPRIDALTALEIQLGTPAPGVLAPATTHGSSEAAP
jgi:cytochrome P450